MDSPAEDERGLLYRFFHNLRKGVKGFWRRHWGAVIGILIAMFLLRGFYQPYILMAREKSFLLMLLVLLAGTWVWVRGRRTLTKVLASVAFLASVLGLLYWGGAAHDYYSLWRRYQTLGIVELSELPITGHERIQPLNSIYSLAHEKVATEVDSPQKPDFVRVDGVYKWTLAIEPEHNIPRFFGSVKELIPVEDRVPDFGKREQVSFQVGENMLLGKNSHTATIKSFGLWRFLNYEPTDPKYIKDDQGVWVQVVPLIHWTGFFYPWPEFGGVQLIRQERLTFWGEIKLLLLGTGEWIRPENIHYYPFLVGQNLLPYEVSRYMAQSFRFESGFWGPMPGNHQGDVRIPDLASDVNNQPFTTYFEKVQKDKPGMLYHYFALEPWDPNKQGLSVSLLIPADGTGVAYVYRHYQHREALTGVSAIATKVRDSQLMIDWRTHGVVENRPFIKDIDGRRRFYWLTSVVTFKEAATKVEGEKAKPTGENSRFIAGTQANIVITDAETNVPVWVSSDPGKWIEEVREELAKRGPSR